MGSAEQQHQVAGERAQLALSVSAQGYAYCELAKTLCALHDGRRTPLTSERRSRALLR
jgi:hypothetical protein